MAASITSPVVTKEVLEHFHSNLKSKYLLDEMTDEEVTALIGTAKQTDGKGDFTISEAV